MAIIFKYAENSITENIKPFRYSGFEYKSCLPKVLITGTNDNSVRVVDSKNKIEIKPKVENI